MDLFDLLCVFLLFLAGAVMEESSINPHYPFANGRNSFYRFSVWCSLLASNTFYLHGYTWTWFNIYKKEKKRLVSCAFNSASAVAPRSSNIPLLTSHNAKVARVTLRHGSLYRRPTITYRTVVYNTI